MKNYPDVMAASWRRWLPGPKYGGARSVGVFGTPGIDDPDQLFELLGRCPRLRALADSRGVTLANDPDSLLTLDRHVDAWNTASPIPCLEPELGCYLGTVIIAHTPGARWRVWPNGHPVVHRPSGADLDVIRLAEPRLRARGRTLTTIYLDATH